MDYTILHALNTFVVAHPLLAHTATLLATWIVPVIVAATVIPWLASGAGVDARKMATAGALAAAALAMGVNQASACYGSGRDRPSPTPATIIPLAGVSADSSFPSDHAAAAFAIAVAAFCVYRHAGRVLLMLAVVAAASRLLVAAHYPTDVIAGALVGGRLRRRRDAPRGMWLPVVRAVARGHRPGAAGIGRCRGSAPCCAIGRCGAGSCWSSGSRSACVSAWRWRPTSSTRCRSAPRSLGRVRRADVAPGAGGSQSGGQASIGSSTSTGMTRSGLALVVGVARVRSDGPLPPDRLLVAGHLARHVLAGRRAVLQFDVRLRLDVAVPRRVLRGTAYGRDDGVDAVVLDAHQRHVAEVPDFAPRIVTRTTSRPWMWTLAVVPDLEDLLGLLANPVDRAQDFRSFKWHEGVNGWPAGGIPVPAPAGSAADAEKPNRGSACAPTAPPRRRPSSGTPNPSEGV